MKNLPINKFTVSSCFPDIIFPTKIGNIHLDGITINSQQVQENYAFIAMQGSIHDGKKYITEAINKGAKVIFIEDDSALELIINYQENIPLLKIKNIRKHIPLIARNIYPINFTDLQILAVTGTNGKSSITHLIAQLLHLQQQKCGVIGTIGNGTFPSLKNSTLTTPDCMELQKWLHNFQQQQIKFISMEASSHALSLNRLVNCKIHTAIFSNLTHEHLDFHKSMSNYFNAKLKLFTQYGIKNAIINKDIPINYYQKFVDIAKKHNYQMLSYSLHDISSDLFASNIQYHEEGIDATIHYKQKTYAISTKLWGKFNLSNLLATIGTMLILKYSLNTLINNIQYLEPVIGRMMLFKNKFLPTTIIDYAHTPDALAQSLQSIKLHTHKNITCIFGCGGNRDKEKRSLMLQSALKYANKIIITADNSRNEDFNQIVKDILQNSSCESQKVCTIIENRAKAINTAIQNTSVKNYVLIAGKGHEDYLLIKNKKIPYSDIQTIKEIYA